MHIAEVVTIAKSLPLLRLNTYKSLILSYSADYRRIFFKNRDHFCDFKNKDLKDYPKFISVIKQFMAYYKLSKFTLKEIDKYLWQLGKEYYNKTQKKK